MTTIKLRSGLILTNPAAMLCAKFQEWPWAHYDGDKPHDSDRLTSADIARVYRLGARTPRAAYEQLIRAHGAAINDALARLPNAPLESVDLESCRKPVIELFDLVLGVKHIKLAGATKLLYPFRPAFLAVLDSVVERYYWYATSILDESQFRSLQRSSWGEYVFELLALLRDDIIGVRAELEVLRTELGGANYANAPGVRLVESLIWWYYARGGSTTP